MVRGGVYWSGRCILQIPGRFYIARRSRNTDYGRKGQAKWKELGRSSGLTSHASCTYTRAHIRTSSRAASALSLARRLGSADWLPRETRKPASGRAVHKREHKCNVDDSAAIMRCRCTCSVCVLGCICMRCLTHCRLPDCRPINQIRQP